MLQFNESATGALIPATFSPAILGKAWQGIASATVGLDTATAAALTARNDGIQLVMDSMRAAQKTKMDIFLKGNAASNQARRDIADMFQGFAADGLMEKSTANMYASSYWLCYEQGISFDAKARDKKAQDKTAKVAASKATTTTIEGYGKTLAKALSMARTLQHNTAGALLDLILEIDPEFSESAE